MTIKEKLESIKGKKIAIWCEEEWMADELYSSNGEESYHNCWSGSDYCVDLEDEKFFTHCDLNWYKNNGYRIIRFEDFIKEGKEGIILSMQDVLEVLDEKYGKDNWVIR